MLTNKDIEKAFDILRKQGKTDEEILVAVYGMFSDGRIGFTDFENIIGTLGFGLTDDFRAMPLEKQRDPEVFFQYMGEED